MEAKEKKITILEDLLALVTLVSIVSISAETVPSLREYQDIFRKIEIGAVSIFVIEYIVRILYTKPRLKYIFSFYGVVDLFSILPTLLGFGNLVFLKSLRIIRISRLFRMLRVFKFQEVAHDIQARKHKEQKINFWLYIKIIVMLSVVFGALIHVFENHNNPLSTIPKGIIWAFKNLTGQTPLVETYTVAGTAIQISLKTAGFILLGMLVYILYNWLKNRKRAD